MRAILGATLALSLLAAPSSTARAALDDREDAHPSETIRVSVTIDFGALERPRVCRDVRVPRGGDVVDATREVLAVEQDRVCCSDEDVWSIGGVGPDVRTGAYWFWKLDGRPGPNLPARYLLDEGDAVLWTYGGASTRPPMTHRIASLLPAATDTVVALGAGDALVGVTHECEVPDRADVARVVSTTLDPDLSMREIDAAVRAASARRESLYRIDDSRLDDLRPTVVFSQGLCPVCAVPPEQAGALTGGADDARCARLVVLTPRTLADVAEDIRRVGDAIGLGNDARVLARDFERRVDAARADAARADAMGRARPRVAVLEWFDPLWVSGEWVVEMVEAAGGDPVLARSGEPSRQVTWEELAGADPDVILLAACSMSIARAGREVAALEAVPAWRELRATRAGRVFLMDGARHVSSPGPGLARGVEVMGEVLAATDDAVPEDPTDWRRVAPAHR